MLEGSEHVAEAHSSGWNQRAKGYVHLAGGLDSPPEASSHFANGNVHFERPGETMSFVADGIGIEPPRLMASPNRCVHHTLPSLESFGTALKVVHFLRDARICLGSESWAGVVE